MQKKILIATSALILVAGLFAFALQNQRFEDISQENLFILCDELPIKISFYALPHSQDRGTLAQIGLTIADHEDFIREYKMPRLEFGGMRVSDCQRNLIIQLKNNDPYNIDISDHESLRYIIGAKRSEVSLDSHTHVYNVKFEEVRFSSRELNEIANLLANERQMRYHNLNLLIADVLYNRVTIGISPDEDADATLKSIVKYLMDAHGIYDENYYRDIIRMVEFEIRSGWWGGNRERE